MGWGELTETEHCGYPVYEVGSELPVDYIASGALAGAAPPPMGAGRRADLINECIAAYVKDEDGRYPIEDLEHDVGRVLHGRVPERCPDWSPFRHPDLESVAV